MAFFTRCPSKLVNLDELYVAKIVWTTGYDNGKGSLGQDVTMFFLVTIRDFEYFELFSGVKLDEELSTSTETEYLDTPYIVHTEPLKKFFKTDQKQIDLATLFNKIININIYHSFGAFQFIDEEN